MSRAARVLSSGLVAVLTGTILLAAAPSATGSAGAAPVATGPGLAAGAAARLQASWTQLLADSRDLGPSRAKAVSVLAQLEHPSSPTTLDRWAAGAGLTVRWSDGDRWAVVSGSPAALDRALRVRIDDYLAPGGRRRFYAAIGVPDVPCVLRAEVVSFGRISSSLELKNFDVPDGGLTPSDVVTAYDASPLVAAGIKGQGRTVVLFETGGYSQTDLNRYTSHFHLPHLDVATIGTKLRSVSGETELDIEAVHDVAPDARILLANFNVETASQMVTIFHTVTKKEPGAIWSFSLGQCETETGFSPSDYTDLDNALLAAESGGSSIFASSGDAGGFDCTPYQDFGDNPEPEFVGVNMPASLPAVTGVGGTSLSTTSDGGYVSESAWTEPLLSQGTGGGISQVWQQPCWQKAPGTGNFSGATPGRQVPDVAAVADPNTGLGVYVLGSTKQTELGGTSLAAPLWAGFTALIDQYLSGKHKPPLGYADPYLYRLASTSQRYPPFHDITRGGNAVYPATRGYDMATGLGSPNVWNLARDLVLVVGGAVC
ncbi:MAG TPA: S53 family peptidase [Acidimicrobiales bacterium]|nr:S53 family peptidase [Acidimicrobiales bacterium]